MSGDGDFEASSGHALEPRSPRFGRGTLWHSDAIDAVFGGNIMLGSDYFRSILVVFYGGLTVEGTLMDTHLPDIDFALNDCTAALTSVQNELDKQGMQTAPSISMNSNN